MKPSKRFRWSIGFAILFLFLIVLLSQVDTVKATFSTLHAFRVYVRVQTEIFQKMPAGQYYESLFWKHNDEVLRIMQAHPEHREVFIQDLRVFVPELEELLDGDGDQSYVTSEHVQSLKAELDWFAAMGSPPLRDDIEREQQRLPLDAMVGMTMNEALEFINSTWIPDPGEEKLFVPESAGKWAYYVYNGVYIEYPGNYSMQISGSQQGYIYFMPSQASPELWNPYVMKVRIWSVPQNEVNANSPRAWYSPESIAWDSPIQNSQFPGVEFISLKPNSQSVDIHAYQYNVENQLAIDTWVFVYDDTAFSNSSNYSELISQQYEYFEHMVENLHVP